jgi:hypothetical protein
VAGASQFQAACFIFWAFLDLGGPKIVHKRHQNIGEGSSQKDSLAAWIYVVVSNSDVKIFLKLENET